MLQRLNFLSVSFNSAFSLSCASAAHWDSYRGGGGIPRGDFSVGKIPYFNLVRNFPLIFRGEVRNFPRAEFCPCKPPYHRMPCA